MKSLLTEREILRQCLDYLEMIGIFAFRVNNMGTYNKKSGGYFFHGTKGVPDILGIIQNGYMMGIEVKRPGKHLSEDQHLFLKRINDEGGFGVCVHSLDELVEALSEVV